MHTGTADFQHVVEGVGRHADQLVEFEGFGYLLAIFARRNRRVCRRAAQDWPHDEFDPVADRHI